MHVIVVVGAVMFVGGLVGAGGLLLGGRVPSGMVVGALVGGIAGSWLLREWPLVFPGGMALVGSTIADRIMPSEGVFPVLLGAAVGWLLGMQLWAEVTPWRDGGRALECLRTERLDIVDFAGHRRASLRTDGCEPKMQVFDSMGSLRVEIAIEEGEPEFSLLGGAGAVHLGAKAAGGEPRLELSDRIGVTRMTLGLDEGDPSIRLLDADRRLRANMALAKANVLLALWDITAEPRLGIVLSEDGASIEFVDDRGRTRMGLALEDGNPVIGLKDIDGEQRAGLSLVGGDPALELTGGEAKAVLRLVDDNPVCLLGRRGEVLWHAP